MCQQTAMIPATKHAARAPIRCTVAFIGMSPGTSAFIPFLNCCVASRPPGKALLLRGCNCSSDLVFDFIGHVTAIQAHEYRGVRDCCVCFDEKDSKGIS